MSSLAVASPNRILALSHPHPALVARPRPALAVSKPLQPCMWPQPAFLVRPMSRTTVVPRAMHPLHQAGQRLSHVHKAAIAPLQQTAPSREFTAVMLGFTAFNLCRNPTLSQALTSAGFIMWPHAMERVFAKHPLLREVGLQAFNFVIVRGNPCGVFLALAACFAAHRLTPHLPKEVHQGVRTIAFWGALVGGARFNRLLGR